MLAAKFRLRHRRDIDRVYKRGRYGRAELLSAKVWRTQGAVSRAVVVVSKKVSKKAVVRNAIRRRLAAQLAQLWETIPTGYDIVINARQDLSKTSVAELKSQLVKALTAAGIRN